ncbi:pep-cterm sorting domain-containing protein [Anaeramoeba flamelloides]|uniref:Pep-cterm sorting domain-containing protein n=1 Tax=Anaeramoeba flamelloides TaxID=1746091 RepID=A0AAV8ADC1_9EUKA|nr:pep-cterm sorting domain-containing protein [Anaeramoeba flamelloides]
MFEPIQITLSKLVDQERFADVKFKVGDDEVIMWGHQLLLSLSSPFWESMFYGENWKETSRGKVSEIVIDDVDPALFSLYLKFTYTRDLLIKDEETIEKLFFLSIKYSDSNLNFLCQDYYKKQLTNDNCLFYLKTSHEFNMKSLKKTALRLLQKSCDSVITSKECLDDFPADLVLEIFSLGSLHLEEIYLFKTLENWGENEVKKYYEQKDPNKQQGKKVDEGKRRSKLKKILKPFLPLIKLEYMNFDDLGIISETDLFPSELILQYVFNLANECKLDLKSLSRFSSKHQKKDKDLKILLIASCRRGNARVRAIMGSIRSGKIRNVDLVSCSDQFVSYEDMLCYDAIVLRTANTGTLKQGRDLGNNLAKFVKTGRGLVIFAINTLHTNDDTNIKGAIYDEKLVPLKKLTRESFTSRNLGTVDLPNHPIMKGVKAFQTKDYCHIIPTEEVFNGKIIAKWSNGYPLITEKRAKKHWGSVVVLNFHPISTETTNTCGKSWLHNTDGNRIISNSVSYVAKKKLN